MRDGSNLASWYQRLPAEEPEAVDAIKADMIEVIDGLKFFRLVPAGGTAKELVATLGAGGGRKTYDLSFDELSLGQRELFALHAIVHYAARRARVLCFDEPDNFVALREIQPWLVKLSDAVDESGTQLRHLPSPRGHRLSGGRRRLQARAARRRRRADPAPRRGPDHRAQGLGGARPGVGRWPEPRLGP